MNFEISTIYDELMGKTLLRFLPARVYDHRRLIQNMHFTNLADASLSKTQ